MFAQAPRRYSAEEYLALDRAADHKSEFVDGKIFAMDGVPVRHVLVATNTAGELSNRLKSGPCQVYGSSLRVQVDHGRAFHYPDVVVVCGPPEYRDARRDTLTNPRVIVEVLSPSTRNYDRGDKFASYRRLDSLRDYVLIDPEPCHVEHYVRKEGGIWEFSEIDDCAGELLIQSLGVVLPLQEIYAQVELLGPDSVDGEAQAPEIAGP